MGKGDKKSKKGKIHIGSYGVRRKRKKSSATTTTTKPKAAAKKAPAKKAKTAE